jgi:N-acetylneuraminate synthase
MNSIDIAGWPVGSGHPCFIIAEAGVNHNGDMAMARRLIEEAARAGVDAVKFQTFTAERLVSPDAPKADYQLQTTDTSETQFEMLRRLELSLPEHRELIYHCQQRGILFLSTPFDEISADFLENLNIAGFKIPSGELTNLPLLEHIARKGRPVILSTGMARLSEVDEAVQAIRHSGNEQLAVLHCVSNYPAEPGAVNLRAMHTLATAFQVPVGFSDHTLGIEIPIAAVASGACIIEKHFTLDKTLPGPDHPASLEPEELIAMVRSIRNVEAALGHGRKEPAASEASTAAVARKSIVAATDIAAGTVLTRDMVALKRPGTGLPPAMLPYVVGRTVRMNIPTNNLIALETLA